MKVVINDTVFNPCETPIVIAFKDDAEREMLIAILQNMQPKDGPRAYLECPDTDEWDKDKRVAFISNAAYTAYPHEPEDAGSTY
jgi:hypothetical protein